MHAWVKRASFCFQIFHKDLEKWLRTLIAEIFKESAITLPQEPRKRRRKGADRVPPLLRDMFVPEPNVRGGKSDRFTTATQNLSKIRTTMELATWKVRRCRIESDPFFSLAVKRKVASVRYRQIKQVIGSSLFNVHSICNAVQVNQNCHTYCMFSFCSHS